MSIDSVVIVGAGHAGVELAHSLRKEKFEGRVVLISAEAVYPYQRPPLSKDFLKGGGDNPLLLKAEALYEKMGIELKLGRTVAGIDRDARTVTLDDGEVIAYDRLALATGARNRRPPVPGLEDPAVLELRDLADSRRLLERLEGLSRVAIVGAGFIGLEIAAFLAEKGKSVEVVELASRVMARAVSEPVSDYFLSYHRGLGTEIHLETGVTAIAHEADGVRVELSDGHALQADAVLLAAGVVPNVELAEAAGLAVADGIVIDDRLRTSDPAIFSLGDCASFPCAYLDGRQIRLESVQNANDQARLIARQVMGGDEAYAALPWFWSYQGEARLQIAGLGIGYDSTVLRGDPAEDKFSVFLYRDGRLVSVESVNAPGDHMASRKLIEKGIEVTPEAAADPATELKKLIV
ncbi:NAD(P)/FAD-dependent oxidoreductase [Amorphus orientalis]|uniref:3-phenylpropionate/trans-cinnamate dioxygenase ferredoxin reductase subunit n=1 Tax=Amorphus orientalis TaxID=649198 RepID=A0AAE3VT13_9HYPH|nr:FAD-dependent oxidoreductase [Amorphus orientalis]MDQ0317618.1 3-phenylpropionate/trans-cinnamate dioxygenase ferredoxin reductase subunit [Amorphus orientalis]